jgi:AraC-like DNA-binding protein
MHFQIIPPSFILAPYVKHYWVLEAGIDEPPVAERVVPTAHVELMFHYKKPFKNLAGPSGQQVQPQSVLSGLGDTWSEVSTQGEAGAIAVTFMPGGAYNFFSFPISEIQGKSIRLDDIFNSEASLLEEQIQAVSELKERIAIIEKFLVGRLRPPDRYQFRLIREGVNQIERAKGQITAMQLSDRLCTTPRTLERKFAACVGKTPKQLIRVIRFSEVLKDLTAHTENRLTEYAYSNGYFDQAHFIREFKEFSGYTPGEMLRRVCHKGQ